MATATERAASGQEQDAIAMLTADHKKVKALFEEFNALGEQKNASDEKAELGSQICMELTIHAQLEEEIFYPAVRKAIDDDELMDEAEAEHAGAKKLIAQIEGMQPGDARYDTTLTELGKEIDHHVAEEEGEMFPKAQAAKLDTAALGKQMAQRKRALQAQG